jgi:hypothetical protein
MQVCRTFLAIGYFVTAVKEPMAVVGMWEESRIFSIGWAYRNFTNRANNASSSWVFSSSSCCISFIASSTIWIITCF